MNRWFQELLSGIDGDSEKHQPDLGDTSNKNSESELVTELEASMECLEANHISIAVLDDGTMRIVQGSTQLQQAVKDGFTIYLPRDMYHVVQLEPHERRLLWNFKK